MRIHLSKKLLTPNRRKQYIPHYPMIATQLRCFTDRFQFYIDCVRVLSAGISKHHLRLGHHSNSLLWNSEGKALILLGCQLKEIVDIQIYREPYENYDREQYEPRVVIDCRK